MITRGSIPLNLLGWGKGQFIELRIQLCKGLRLLISFSIDKELWRCCRSLIVANNNVPITRELGVSELPRKRKMEPR